MASAAVHPGNATNGLLFEPTQAFVPQQTTKSTAGPNAASAKHDVRTTLNYYRDPGDGSAPTPSYVSKPETYDRPVEKVEVTVSDIRGEEERYSLDGNGFEIFRHESGEKEFVDDEAIRKGYYAEVEQLLKDATGASKVYIFDHTIRRPSASSENPLRGPVRRVHIDQSYSASLNRVKHHLPAEAEHLLQGRVQIINVWRPIHTIFKDPLTVAEAQSVSEEDLVPVGLIYPDRKGETYTVKPNPGHRWFYLHAQTPEEVLLIKCFDTKQDGRARRVPHTAFVNEEYDNEKERERESIEVRALVFHEDDRE